MATRRDFPQVIKESHDEANNALRVVIEGGGPITLSEIATPANPADGDVKLFARDSGAGLTELVALFTDGTEVQLAVEV